MGLNPILSLVLRCHDEWEGGECSFDFQEGETPPPLEHRKSEQSWEMVFPHLLLQAGATPGDGTEGSSSPYTAGSRLLLCGRQARELGPEGWAGFQQAAKRESCWALRRDRSGRAGALQEPRQAPQGSLESAELSGWAAKKVPKEAGTKPKHN